MRAIYDGVDLMPLETLYFDWESVYDSTGVDFLYNKVSMAVRSIVNGISSVMNIVNGPPINYGFLGDPSLSQGQPIFRSPPTTVPPGFPGNTVPADFGIDLRNPATLRAIVRDPGGGINPTDLTHAAIRYRLSVPRKKLYIFSGSGMESGAPPAGTLGPPNAQVARLFLESPDIGKSCDCKNGPFPRILSVTQALGDATTLIVDWAVETYVNEGVDNEVRPNSALLSNRFSQIHSVDDDGWTMVTTQGVAVFRTDFVYSGPASPDAFRPYLFMPLSDYFVRRINYVKGREDVTGVEYSYTDTQKKTNFVAGPFVRGSDIHVVHSQTMTTNPDLIGSALTAYERMLNIRANRRFAKGDQDKPPDAHPKAPREATPTPPPKTPPVSPTGPSGAKVKDHKPGMAPP